MFSRADELRLPTLHRMPPRARRLLLAAGLGLALTAGCTSDGGVRAAGTPVTEDEAAILAALLQRNEQRGGADFVVTAPYGEHELLTLTGTVDFRNDLGRAQAVTSFDDGRPEDIRTLFFTPEEIWVGDVPGLTDALAGRGAPPVSFLRRPVTTESTDGAPPLLVDVLTEVLLNLASRRGDDPRAFLDGDYTWEGQRSIDSRLATLFGAPEGRTVAVDATEDLLTQFVTTVADADFDVTVTLSDHGIRRIDLPAAEETADAAEHADVAALLGI